MDLLLGKIGQLAIFLICAQTLLHFRAKASYEKYIKLLVSMMLLILLVEPIMNLFGKKTQGDFLESMQVYEAELMDILENQQLDTGEISEKLLQMTQSRAIQIETIDSVEIEVEHGEDS